MSDPSPPITLENWWTKPKRAYEEIKGFLEPIRNEYSDQKSIIDDIEKTQERFGRFHIDGLTKACKEIIKCLNDKLAAHCRDAKIHTKQETSCPVPVLVHEIHVYLTRYLNITTEKAREEDRVYYAIQYSKIQILASVGCKYESSKEADLHRHRAAVILHKGRNWAEEVPKPTDDDYILLFETSLSFHRVLPDRKGVRELLNAFITEATSRPKLSKMVKKFEKELRDLDKSAENTSTLVQPN